MISILYVDDEPFILEVTREYLTHFDLQADTAASGTEALKKLETNHYDAIVSDFSMPGMDGIALLKEVRKQYPDLPFILFTGRGREEVVIEAIENGADFYLQKGGRPTPQFTELATKIRQAIELRRGKQALRESEMRFRSLIQNSSDIIRILDKEGNIIFESPSSSKILQYPVGSLIGKNAFEYIHPGDRDRIRHDFQEVCEQINPGTPSEYRIRKEDGTYLYVESTGLNLIGVPGVDGIVVTTHPVHVQKMVEHQLRESETRLHHALEGAGEGLWDWHFPSGKAYFSPRYYTMLGYEPDEFPATFESWVALLHPDEKNAVISDLLNQIREKRTSFKSEYRIRTKEGDWCWILGRGKAIEWDKEGNIIRLIGTNADITYRKKADIALQESYQKLAQAQRIAHIGSWEDYLPTKELQWSEEMYHILGFPPGTPVNLLDIVSIFPPDELTHFQQAVHAAIHEDTPYSVDYKIIRNDGKVRYVHDEGEVIRDENGMALWMIGTTQDITDLRLVEQALRESERKYRSIFDNAAIGICQISKDGQIISANTYIARILGYDSKEELIASITNINTRIFNNPDQWDDIKKILSEKGFLEYVEIPCINKYGHQVWVSCNGRVVRDSNGAVLHFEGTVQDITPRKLAEDNLRFQSKILEIMAEGIIVTRVGDGVIVFTNPTFDKLFGYDTGELIGKQISLINAPENKKTPDEKAEEIKRILNERGEWRGEIQNIKKDGSTFWCQAAVSLYDHPEYGKIGISVHSDITERKNTEAALRESEQKFRIITERSPDHLIIQDLDLRYTYVLNPQLGLHTEDMIGKTDYDFLSKEDAEKLTIVKKQVIDTGITLRMETALQSLKGGKEYFEGSYIPKYNDEGRIDGIMGYFRNISERKHNEEALRKLNRQLNLMTSITRHDILNKVFVLQSLFDLLKPKIDTVYLTERLENIDQVINSIQSQIEFTQIYQDLGVQDPRWQNLRKILLKEVPPDSITYAIDSMDVEIHADPLFEKVFSNLLDNSIKHGQRVKNIHVSSRESLQGLIIIWEDDGVGIPACEKELIFERGYGKNSGLGLFFIREILSITGITISESGQEGKGARFELLVPMEGFRYISGSS